MTIETMQKARQAGKSETDWQQVKAEEAAGIEPAEDADSPDATAAMKKALVQRRAGRPAGSGTKQQIAIRLDSNIVETFRQGGPGWQTRINDALKNWLAEHPPKV